MEREPLTQVSGREIAVRVVYQLIKADYRQNSELYDNPADRLFKLSLEWRLIGYSPIPDLLVEAAYFCARGGKIADWVKSKLPTVANQHSTALRIRRGPGR